METEDICGASGCSATKIFVRRTKLVVDTAGFLMEAVTAGSGPRLADLDNPLATSTIAHHAEQTAGICAAELAEW